MWSPVPRIGNVIYILQMLCVIASRSYHLFFPYSRESEEIHESVLHFGFVKWRDFSFLLQDMGSGSDVTDSSSNEAGHRKVTIIHGHNGLPKQVRVILLQLLRYRWCLVLKNTSSKWYYVLPNSRSHTSPNMWLELVLSGLYIRLTSHHSVVFTVLCIIDGENHITFSLLTL